MDSKESQIKRMVKLMKQRKVANHEWPKMYILNATARISNIRAMGITVSKERVYDEFGKATGTFLYWIPRAKKASIEYEDLPKSSFLRRRLHAVK